MKDKEVVAALNALAQNSRLAVYRLLVKRGPEGYPAGEIAVRLRIPGPTMSFHLKELTQAGLLTVRREGRYLHYSANFDRMNSLVEFLTENCCSLATAGEPGVCIPARTTAKRKAA